MPALEIACLGGGTSLEPQRSLIKLTGSQNVGDDEKTLRLAEVMAATVMAGELSLMAAHTSNHLVSAHMKLGRK